MNISRLNRYHVVLPEHGLAYLNLPKSACTSIKASLARLKLGRAVELPRDEALLEKLHGGLFKYMALGDLIKSHPDCFTFTFVRNPWHRLVSFYHGKINVSSQIDIRRHWGFKPGTTFPECVSIVCNTPDSIAEPHFRSQSDQISCKGSLYPDYVGKIENLPEDWQILQERIREHMQRSDRPFKALPMPMKLNQRDHPPYQSYYDGRLMKMVANRYRDDISLFEYRFEQ